MKHKSILCLSYLFTIILTALITYFVVNYQNTKDQLSFDRFNTELTLAQNSQSVLEAYKKGNYDIALHELKKFASSLSDMPHAAALPEKQVVCYQLFISAIEYKIKEKQSGTAPNDLKNAYEKMLVCMSRYNDLFPDKKNSVTVENIDQFIDVFNSKK